LPALKLIEESVTVASNLSADDSTPTRVTGSASVSSDNDGAADGSAASTLNFEQALLEIESIVGQLESGRLGLEQALERYEAGVRHLKQCHQALRQAERRIELLVGINENGTASTRPFDDEALSLEDKPAARSRRRTIAED
jgi:exodeoxyribonuclease VII small subunit